MIPPLSLSINDFFPGVWEIQDDFIVDRTTKNSWLDYNVNLSSPPIGDISPKTLVGIRIRIRLIGRMIAQLFIQPILSLGNVILRVIKLITFFNFWKEMQGEPEYDFEARLFDTINDCFKILVSASLISLISIELALLYGLLSPNDGIKFHNSFEIAIYGTPISSERFYTWEDGRVQLDSEEGFGALLEKWLIYC